MAKISPNKKNGTYSNLGYSTPVPEHPSLEEVYEETPFSEEFWTYLNYVILNIFGWLRDLLRNARIENRKGSAENNPPVNNHFLFYLS
jgi:hypothetical protein